MKKKTLLFLILMSLVLIFTLLGPLPQNESYHHFSDADRILGIPNFHNVFSNILFAVFSLIGIKGYLRDKTNYSISWLVFYVGVFFVTFGSAYYHWNPTSLTLVWDRLPMSLAFMALFTAITKEIFEIKNELPLLIASSFLGIYSVIHWSLVNDLRLYAWVQITPILTILYSSLFLKVPSLKRGHIIFAVLFYGLAKLFETYDPKIHEILGYSGHPIKHFLAAFSVYSLILMKKSVALRSAKEI